MANYYAVFDGHAGQDAATYCATHLHQYLAESIYYPTDPERALRDAFITTDAQFIEKSKTQVSNKDICKKQFPFNRINILCIAIVFFSIFFSFF